MLRAKKQILFFLSYVFIIHFQIYTSENSVLVSSEEMALLLQEHTNDLIYKNNATPEELEETRRVNQKKPITLLIYAAADNDLHPYVWKNIKQMEAIGSNENINILVQLNTPGYFNPTKRYLIKKGKRLLVPTENAAPTQKLNSGSPYTLIDAAAWAMKYYPADEFVLNLWDHGSGVYDPGTSRIVNSVDLFKMNKTTNMFDLDRTITYADYIENHEISPQEASQNNRGICFDDTFKSYMNNHDLKFALSEIQRTVLKGKKIGVLWFDACLMAMLEIASICKDHVNYMVGAEEVEYATGSNYELVLQPFINNSLSLKDFSCHIVNSFEKAYYQITKDYTQSALDLQAIAAVEENVHLVAGQLIIALQNQINNSVTKLLQSAKSRQMCTIFEEPSYIDLKHFYTNVLNSINQISLDSINQESAVKNTLSRLLNQGINLINTAVVANKVGMNLRKASGISIYFPERGLFNSYQKNPFALANNWSKMLSLYISCQK